jgi:nucleotide-binding universal stress UspA family protein
MRHGIPMTHASAAPARLLVAYDGSDAGADAVRAAARLFPGAEASVMHVRPPSLGADQAALARIAMPDAVIAAATQEHERTLRGLAEELAERGRAMAERAGLRATAEIRAGTTAWRAIADAARDADVDVIACGSRGEGPVSRSLLGSTSSSLLYHADRSVLVVPPGAGDLDGPTLIGYDGSEGAGAAVDAAARLLPGRPAIVVHAWSSPLERSYAGQSLALVPLREIGELRRDVQEMFAGHSAELAEEGAARARAAGLDATAKPVEAHEGTWRALAAAAESEGAAVVVAGNRGRGAMASSILGSVSAGLVHNADVPVLVVR